MGVDTGVGFRSVPASVHEERLEEAKVLGVLLLTPNLSARCGRGGTGTGNFSSSFDFFVFMRPKKETLRFVDTSERYPPSDSSSLVTAPSFFLGFFLDFPRVASFTELPSVS